MINTGYSKCDGFFFNNQPKDIPVGFRNLFGVIQQGMGKCFRQYNRSGKYGPGQAATAGFITTGFS